jgi:cold shock CspA family protein
MAKSTQSFNKKEREKKQQQKRQEKEQKKEDRKAHSSKGRPMDDMFAYVDEYGNISDTPPTERKKRDIEQDDIQISIPKQVIDPTANAGRKGIVTFYNESKGYGFIRDLQSQESIFVHISELLEPIKEHDKVTYELEKKQKGWNAVKVKRAV